MRSGASKLQQLCFVITVNTGLLFAHTATNRVLTRSSSAGGQWGEHSVLEEGNGDSFHAVCSELVTTSDSGCV